MALAGVPPWLDITPETFSSQIRAGASAGTQLRGQDIAAAESGDRLRLAYAQLQSQEERASEAANARLQLAHAQLSAKQQQADLMAQFRVRAMDQAQQRQDELAKYRDQSLAERQSSGAALMDLRERRLEDLDAKREHDSAMQEKNLALREAVAKRPRLTESDRALMGSDVTELKKVENDLDALHPSLIGGLLGKNAQIRDLRAKALKLRGKIASYEPQRLALGGTTDAGEAAAPTQKKRVRVTGPGGKKGTIEEGDTLPEGWQLE